MNIIIIFFNLSTTILQLAYKYIISLFHSSIWTMNFVLILYNWLTTKDGMKIKDLVTNLQLGA